MVAEEAFWVIVARHQAIVRHDAALLISGNHASSISVLQSTSAVLVQGNWVETNGDGTSAWFTLVRTGGTSVTLPIVVTGSFGTWRTFVGGGPDAW